MEKWQAKLSKFKFDFKSQVKECSASKIQERAIEYEDLNAGPSHLQETTSDTGRPNSHKRKSDDSYYSNTDSSLQSSCKKMRKSYKQKFNEEWLDDPVLKSWITSSKSKGYTAYCKFCDININGSKTLMIRHANTPKHKQNIDSKRNTPGIISLFNSSSRYQSENQIKEAELRLCAYVAEHNLPLRLMDTLPTLLKTIVPDSEIAKKIQCGHTKCNYLIKNALAVDSLNQISKKLKSTYFSVIIDESTDLSANKSLAVVVRYYDDSTKSVEDSFLNIIDVKDATSSALFETLLELLNKLKVPLSNLLGFAADNASVMMGQHSGIQARLKSLNEHLFVARCICHSFNLCAAEACKKLPNSLEELCADIYNFIQKKPKRLTEFRQIQDISNLKAHNLLRLGKTRWLSMHDVVQRIVEQWDALMSYFTLCAVEDGIEQAKSIVTALQNQLIKAYFLFLAFILPTVVSLNLDYQGTEYRLHLLISSVGDKMKMIMKYFMKSQYIINTPIENINPADNGQFLDIENVYLGARVEALLISLGKSEVPERDIINFKVKCLSFYIEFCSQVLKRINFKDPVLKSLAMLNPETCKSDSFYSIMPLAVHFPNVIEENSYEELDREWQLLKTIEALKTDQEFMAFWNKVFEMKNAVGEQMFPKLTTLVKALLCLPHSSAATERIFSAVTINKNKIRNQLQTPLMNALLLTKEKLKHSSATDFTINADLINLAKSAKNNE